VLSDVIISVFVDVNRHYQSVFVDVDTCWYISICRCWYMLIY